MAPVPASGNQRLTSRIHTGLLRQLDLQPTQEQGLDASSYEVLLRLAEAPGGTMRMKDLADSLLLSRMIGTDQEDSRRADVITL